VSEWPELVERVLTFLSEAGAEARVEEFAEGTATAEDAAKALGCDPALIVKTLVFECDGRPVLVLVPGDRRASARKVAGALGASRARIATPAQVEETTGFAPGGVAPFPLRVRAHALIDQSLLTHPLVWTGAGSPLHMVGISPAELVRLTRANAMDVIDDG